MDERTKDITDYFYFENKTNGHNKFWAVEIKEVDAPSHLSYERTYSLTRRWGMIGTNGQAMIESFPSMGQASIRKATLINEKLAKGYEPIM